MDREGDREKDTGRERDGIGGRERRAREGDGRTLERREWLGRSR